MTLAANRRIKAAMVDLAEATGPPNNQTTSCRSIQRSIEHALEIAVAGRAEFGIADERGLTVTKRNLMARTAICRCTWWATGSRIGVAPGGAFAPRRWAQHPGRW